MRVERGDSDFRSVDTQLAQVELAQGQGIDDPLAGNSVGDFAEGDDREEVVLRDAARGTYKRVIVKDDRYHVARPRPTYEDLIGLDSVPDWF